MIPIGLWHPDKADSNPNVCRQALNVLLIADGNGVAHAPHPGLAVAPGAAALPADPKGGTSIVNSTGSYSCVVGTATALYRLQADYTWTTLATGYAVPDGDRWSFTRHGAYLIATNVTNGMLEHDVDAATAPVAVTGAPKARFIFNWLDSIFALDCDGDNRLMRYSAQALRTEWRTKGAGSQSFYEGEELICGTALSRDLAIIWQRNQITLLTRLNDGARFASTPLYKERGCVNAAAMCSVDGRAFFLDTDGFYMIGPDGGLNNIGQDKVSRTFLARLSSEGMNTVEAAVDKVNNRIVWRYRRQDVVSATIFDDAIAFNYLLGEWSEIEEQTTAIFSMASPAYTLDAMASFGPLDSITIPLDSRFWAGGEPRLAALDEARKFAFFDGANLASVSETGTTVFPQSMLVTSLTKDSDSLSGRVKVGARQHLAAAITWKDGVLMQPSGRFPVRARGKCISLQHVTDAGESWSYFRGFDNLVAAPGGPR